MEEPEYISVQEASERIGICPDGIRKLAKQPGFPCVRIGRRYIINKKRFFEWMDKNEGKEIVIE
ncbi:MAG: helix-turn-helix domain-containing protein [Eubacterium sp.]|nr:helix-turn-helix domain-containing protein [Eubacterium sp.]